MSTVLGSLDLRQLQAKLECLAKEGYARMDQEPPPSEDFHTAIKDSGDTSEIAAYLRRSDPSKILAQKGHHNFRYLSCGQNAIVLCVSPTRVMRIADKIEGSKEVRMPIPEAMQPIEEHMIDDGYLELAADIFPRVVTIKELYEQGELSMEEVLALNACLLHHLTRRYGVFGVDLALDEDGVPSTLGNVGLLRDGTPILLDPGIFFINNKGLA